MGRKAEVQRVALERLMGPEVMGTADKDMHFTDPKVCRNFLCGTCPHDLFSNTEMYDAAVARGETFPQITAEHERSIHMFITDMDRKIAANRRRLDQTPEEMERSNAIMRDINEIGEAITAAENEMEKLGEQGQVEESLKELAKVDALKAERSEKEKEFQVLQENSGASGHQKLRVCDVCGAYLSILDSDRRLADHFSGKMHLGYLRLRELLVEFEKRKQSGVAYRMDPCLLNQKSNTVEGYWLLAELLRRVAIEPKDSLPMLTAGTDETLDASGSKDAQLLPMQTSRTYEPYDVYAAVERKDVDTIMAIRDANFALLLGGEDARTPLEYAISLGPAYERVSLFLAGALSRFVNNLPDEMQNADPETLAVLRKVRTNLKLAIDHSLGREQTSLVASYIQILVMAEGLEWVTQSARAVAYELRSRASADPYATRPTQVAQDIVGRFLTQNLRTRRNRDHYVVAAIEDYIANAASDLVLLALWDCVRGGDDPLPDYAFARDDRLSVAFVDAVTSAKHKDERRPQRIWVQAQRAADALQSGLRGRTAHERLALLAQIVD
ncbi:splicing factor [Malassezia brasiliensis]|uniref:Splicing factor n=1 Tax=Malassezia brasiliensis TaxID=1821822 RepID=A0AAF0DR08_9BASI|nr:splicing factor [Malassezia brasiliensis]